MSRDADKAGRWELVDRCFDEVLDAPPGRRDSVLEALRETYPDSVVDEVSALVDSVDSTHPVLSDPAPAQVDVIGPDDIDPPETIRRWRVGSLLGAGGQGRVYLATKQAEQFEQTGALKILGDHMGSSAMQRFLRERQTLARLRHPNIATLLDAGASEDGRPYLVSECIEGQTLDRFLDVHRPSAADSVRLLLPVVEAVAHAHQQFVLHRDIKPANIIVDAQGVPYLLDFGVSAAIAESMSEGSVDAESADAKRAESVPPPDLDPYTPSYAAPEQILNRPVDVRTDCWALGALLYRALAGSSPFAADDAGRTIRAVLYQSIRPPSADPELNAIVAKCLSRSKDARYDSVAALRADLQAWLDGDPVSAAADSRWYRVSKWLKRHRVLAGSTALLAMSLILGAVVSTYQAQRASEQRDRATAAAQQYQSAVGLLVDVFNGANPALRRGEVPSADDLLEEARARVLGMERQPGVQATLAHELAAVYLNRGDAQRAARLSTLAIEHFETTGRTQSETYANTLVSLATAFRMLGRYVESAVRLDRSLQVQREHLWPANDWRYAYTENMLGGVLSQMGDHEGARARFASALRAVEGSDEAPAWFEGTVRLNLWDSEVRLGKLPDVRQALISWLALRSPDAPEEPRASAQASLGDIALAEARYPDARDRYLEAARLLDGVYGPDHPTVLLHHERAAWVEILAAGGPTASDRERLSRQLELILSERPTDDRLRLAAVNHRLSLTGDLAAETRAVWVRAMLEAGPDAPIPDRLLWHQHLLLRAIAAHVAGLSATAHDALGLAASTALYDTAQASWQRVLEEQMEALINRGDPVACRTLRASLSGPLALELGIAARALACQPQNRTR